MNRLSVERRKKLRGQLGARFHAASCDPSSHVSGNNVSSGCAADE